MNCNSFCNICCDNYNKSNRIKILCPYCNFDVCRTCCETYILSENIPKCMKPECAKEWSRKFMRENFTNIFLTSKYKTHLENILFDQEKALLPATQILVEESIIKKKIKKEINEYDLLITDLINKRQELEIQIRQGIKVEKSIFVRQCPSNGCRGFLSSQWKCGLCEKWSCPECHELKGLTRDCEHTCDPNNVETAKLLSKDSKPCPKCQSLIFKISGCDQMWCTQCHTAFSWKTCKLEQNIHNPHYYEWKRKNGDNARNIGDIECGMQLTHNTISIIKNLSLRHSDLFIEKQEQMRFSSKFYSTHSEYIIKICNIIINIIHNNQVELRQFEIDHVIKNQDLRIKYLENLISEEDFKILIQRNDKKNRKNNEITQVMNLANTTTTDIIYRLIDNLKNSTNGNHNIISYLNEIEEIITYCNDIFKDICFTYNTSIQYKFNESFKFIRLKK